MTKPINRLLRCVFALLFCCVAAQCCCDFTFAQETESVRWTIVIHGGAGADPSRWSSEQIQIRENGLRTALQTGVNLLETDREAMDVVEQVIRVLEDDPNFNAGCGAVLNADGNASLDASIMDGESMQCGAVAGVQTVKNPISVARKVISDTPHVLLGGSEADGFAKLMGVEIVENDYFVTDTQRAKWTRWKQRQNKENDAALNLPKGMDDPLFYLGTVGCVVLDARGNLAAGTSTGGMLGKQFGRIGDSPIIGAGTYAKNATCAISCTGVGELFIRHSIAANASLRMELTGASLQTTANFLIDQILPKDSGGLIAVDRDGNYAMPFNTPGMARGVATHDGVFEIGIGRD